MVEIFIKETGRLLVAKNYMIETEKIVQVVYKKAKIKMHFCDISL